MHGVKQRGAKGEGASVWLNEFCLPQLRAMYFSLRGLPRILLEQSAGGSCVHPSEM